MSRPCAASKRSGGLWLVVEQLRDSEEAAFGSATLGLPLLAEDLVPNAVVALEGAVWLKGTDTAGFAFVAVKASL